MKPYLFVLVIVAAVFAGGQQPVRAQTDRHDFDITHQTEIDPEDPAQTQVTHTVTVTNRTEEALNSLELAVPAATLEGLEVTSAGEVEYTAELSRVRSGNRPFHLQVVSLQFDDAATGADESWDFTVRYTAPELVRTASRSAAMLLPALDGGIGADWQWQLRIPRDWPGINYDPPVHSLSLAGSHREFMFRGEDINSSLFGVSFAETAIYELTQQTQLHNRALWPQTKQLLLPGDTHQQTAYLAAISPEPQRLYTDQDGNTIAAYRLRPWQSLDIEARWRLKVDQLRYDPAEAGDMADIPEALEEYTIGDDDWPTQTAIGEQATRLIEPDADAWGNVRQLHDYVQSDFELDPQSPTDADTETVFETKAGTNRQIADVLVTMLRSQGIPARAIAGGRQLMSSAPGVAADHTWVEAYVAGLGWVTLDPLWSHAFGSFGYSSFDHLAFSIISQQEQRRDYELPSAADMDITTAEAMPQVRKKPLRIAAARYMLLPGIAIDQVTATNQSGYAVDGVNINGAKEGTLAPRSTARERTWSWSGWESFQASVTSPSQELTVTAERVWWPLLAVTVLLSSAGMLQFYGHRITQYFKRRLHG